MPTILQRIDVSLSGNAVTDLVAQQAGQLTSVATLVEQLRSSPPGIGELVARLDALGPPGFSLSGNVSASFDAVRAALPADLDDLARPAQELLASFGSDIAEQLAPVLGDAVKVARAVQQLLSIRLRCPPASSESGGAEAPPGDPSAPPESAQRAQAVADQIAQVSGMLDQLPQDVPPIFVLIFILQRLGSKPRDRFFNVNLPVIDDLLEPLQTLAELSIAAPAEIADQFAASLTAFTQHVLGVSIEPLAQMSAELGAIEAQVAAVPLGDIADQMAAAFGSLNAALASADLTSVDAIVVDADALLDTFDGLRAQLAPVLPALVPAAAAWSRFPAAAFDRLEHLLSLLQPANFASTLAGIADLPNAPTDAQIQAVRDAVQPVFDWLNELLEALNFEAIQAQIGGVADALRDTSSQLTASLTQVGTQAGAMFQTVDDAVAGVGLEELRASLQAQIAQFSASLRTQIENAFAPARSALETALAQVTAALELFDPQTIVGALEDAIQSLVDVLNAPEIRAAIDDIKATVDGVASALEQLSFAPVTDEVVGFIDKMRAALDAALRQDINEAAKTALTAGLAALPRDLQPVTDPLIDDFARLIEQGPISLLERVRDEPRKIVERLRKFEPAALIGTSLEQSHRQLATKLDDLSIRALLAPAEQALDAQKRRLLKTANPASALRPLSDALADIRSKLDRLSPGALLAPLERSLQEAIDRIIDVSPVDEVFEVVNDVFATINSVLAVLEQLRGILQKVDGILTSFDDVDAQLDAWRDDLLENVTAAAGAAVDASLASLEDALAGTHHAAVTAQVDAAASATAAALDALDPAARLSALVQPYGQAKSRATALSPSPTRTAVLALLNRFDPARAADAAPFRDLEVLRGALSRTRQELESMQQSWSDAVAELDPLRTGGSLTGDALRTALSEHVELALAPVRVAFRMIERAKPPFAATLAALEQLVTELTTRVTALLNGPDSLQAISTAVQSLVDELRGFDLSVVTAGLDESLRAVSDRLAVLDPAALGSALNAEFSAALEPLSLDQLIPDGSLAALDAALANLREAVATVNPQQIVTSAVQPIYEETLLPLADAFDLTPIFGALIDYLDQLDEELRAEMARVNTAYQAFIRTRGSSAGASVSVGG